MRFAARSRFGGGTTCTSEVAQQADAATDAQKQSTAKSRGNAFNNRMRNATPWVKSEWEECKKLKPKDPRRLRFYDAVASMTDNHFDDNPVLRTIKTVRTETASVGSKG